MMKISIEIPGGIRSPHDGTMLLPQLHVVSSAELTVSGLYDDKPHILEMVKKDSSYAAIFFLHTNITAHIHSGDFDIFITNTHHFIGCLATNKSKPFMTTQEMEYSEIREERISDTLLNDFVVLQEHQTTTIEYLSEDKETDKLISL